MKKEAGKGPSFQKTNPHVGVEGEVVVVVLKFLGGGEGVSDLDVAGHESIAVVVDPVEHLEQGFESR